MSDYNRRLGQYGENLAAEFLIRRGCRIIDQNFATPYGELDLIATNGDEILFIEVKTRTNVTYGYPEIAVDTKKLNHLQKYFLCSKESLLEQLYIYLLPLQINNESLL